MYFITALIVINFGLSYCFIFLQHRGALELKEDLIYTIDVDGATEEWIEQPVDHFGTNNETWKMRYFKRLTFWKPGGPIYLLINGDYNLNLDSIRNDTYFTCQLANETNGAVFLSEHRYYGHSKPNDKSLKYLSSKQGLADLVTLIKAIKSAPEFKSSKVVVLGASYAGNLAAWMRALYPNLVDAAVASSAPVLAKKDFYEYFETVPDIYEKYGSPDCVKKIDNFFKHLVDLLKNSSGIEQLKKELHICDESDMSDVRNQQLLFDCFFEILGYLATFETPDEIMVQCQYLQKENGERPMQELFGIFHKHFTSKYLRTTNTGAKTILKLKKSTEMSTAFDDMCYDYNYTDFLKVLRAHKNNYFTYLYQSCTEFGYFATTTSGKPPFYYSLPLDYYIKQCQFMFGEDFDEKRVDDGVAQTNAMHGGITPNVTNVVFTHGDMDPWRRLGVVKDLSDTVVVKITNGTSHWDFLGCPGKPFNQHSEPDALAKDKEYVRNMIKKWIGKA